MPTTSSSASRSAAERLDVMVLCTT